MRDLRVYVWVEESREQRAESFDIGFCLLPTAFIIYPSLFALRSTLYALRYFSTTNNRPSLRPNTSGKYCSFTNAGITLKRPTLVARMV